VSSPPSRCRCRPVVLPSPSRCPIVAFLLSYCRHPIVLPSPSHRPTVAVLLLSSFVAMEVVLVLVIQSFLIVVITIVVLVVSSRRCPRRIIPSLSLSYRPVVVLVVLSLPSCRHSYDPARPTNEQELILLSSVVSSLSLAPSIPPYEQRLVAVIMGGCLVGHGSCYTVLP
jgi:O-antigen ligase